MNAFAATRTIGDLSDGALIGPIASTQQLQQAMRDRAPLIAQAGSDLGLSAADVATVQARIERGQARYVRIPRHLDGMAGEHGGVAFAVHDVEIPANVYGWEVDLNEPTATVRVFIPNQCGNISYLRVPRARIAAARPYRIPRAVAVAPTPSPEPIALPAAPIAYATPSPAPAFAPVNTAPASSTPATVASHHLGVLPFIAAALVGFALSSHGSSGGNHTTPGVTPKPVASCAPAIAIRI